MCKMLICTMLRLEEWCSHGQSNHETVSEEGQGG